MARLRGAGVDTVDLRRLGQVVVALVMVGLAVLVVVLYVAGARKNAQITSLRDDGVPVVVTVVRCQGELGGSGSNDAGYVCQGRYHLDGRSYVEAIPGNAPHDPGERINAVAVPSDPRLVSPAGTVAAEQPSAGVYVVPTVLLVVLLGMGGGLLVVVARRRRDGRPEAGRPPSVASTSRPASPATGS